MTTDNLRDLLSRVASWDWPTIALFAVPALLVATLIWAALSDKPDRRVTLIATIIGLTWMAQGMYDAATTDYQVPEILAGVLFLLFEAFSIGAMLRANRFRRDLPRRRRHVAWVWMLAAVAALVVAFAEGWQQAPLRLAVPFLVAGNWYVDLTADDDPAEALPASWRWTPRRLLLWVGAIEAQQRDAVTIDRDRLRDRMTRLAFVIEHGAPALNDLFRRPLRLARLQSVADDADLAEVRSRLDRSRAVLVGESEPEPVEQPAPEVHPVTPPQPKPKEIAKPGKPAERKQGEHTRVGRTMRREELRADAFVVMRRSMTADRPKGMTASELAALYVPPLGIRTAEQFAAEARRAEPVNGHRPGIVVPGGADLT